VPLTLSLLKHLLGAPLGWLDLEALDPELARHLAWLLDQPEAAVADLELDFTVATTATGPDKHAVKRAQRLAGLRADSESAARRLAALEAEQARRAAARARASAKQQGKTPPRRAERAEAAVGMPPTRASGQRAPGSTGGDAADDSSNDDFAGLGAGSDDSDDAVDGSALLDSVGAMLAGPDAGTTADTSDSSSDSDSGDDSLDAEVDAAIAEAIAEARQATEAVFPRNNAGGGARASSADPGAVATKRAVVVHALKPGGQHVSVTASNRLEYVTRLAEWHLASGIEAPLFCFLEGFHTVIPPDLLAVFDYAELEFLLCGSATIDVADWMRHSDYGGEFSRSPFVGSGASTPTARQHPVIAWFWEVVRDDLDDSERQRLFQFATGGGRVPAQGFKALQRNDGKYCRFHIRSQDADAAASGSLPVSHTCFNRLDLPVYATKAKLLEALKLVTSLEVTGFSMD